MLHVSKWLNDHQNSFTVCYARHSSLFSSLIKDCCINLMASLLMGRQIQRDSDFLQICGYYSETVKTEACLL